MSQPDPTEALRAAEAREAELREALERAGAMAHDLNNTLGAAVALPELMEMDLEEILAGRGTEVTHRSLRRALRLMNSASTRAVATVQELLALGRQYRSQESRHDRTDELARLPTGSERVLVVDDEEGQRDVAVRILQRLGYSAVAVADGESALTRFTAAHRLGRPSPCDLVLMDVRLGEGMDGVAALEAILALYPGQRALVMSGFAPSERDRSIMERGVQWLVKPYDVPELAKALRACLES